MIKLYTKGRDECCGGYSYYGYATFDGFTVKEALDEIREYAKDTGASWLGDGFGNPNVRLGGAWSISINGVRYWNSWNGGEHQVYDGSLDEEWVKEIRVDGGWYCFWNFEIITM